MTLDAGPRRGWGWVPLENPTAGTKNKKKKMSARESPSRKRIFVKGCSSSPKRVGQNQFRPKASLKRRPGVAPHLQTTKCGLNTTSLKDGRVEGWRSGLELCLLPAGIYHQIRDRAPPNNNNKCDANSLYTRLCPDISLIKAMCGVNSLCTRLWPDQCLTNERMIPSSTYPNGY